jgi:hypothetical protein
MVFRLDNTLTEPRNVVYAAKPNAARILDVYRQATLQELQDGLDWYLDAHKLAVALDPERPHAAAGVLAALSPMKTWGKNVNMAVRAYADGYASGGLYANCAKADAIMAGSEPLDVLGGNKVCNFYKAIADPHDGSAVVIDRHAFDIAVGRITNDKSRTALSRKGVYDQFARAYVRAAKTIETETGLDISPCQLQAVTWTVWRRLKGLAGE